MSDTDSFIDEVTEEVRRDRLFAMMKRYGWIAVLVVLLVVGGAAFREYRSATEQAKAEALGDAMLAALENDDSPARIAALSDVQSDSAGGRAVARMLETGELVRNGEEAAAITLLDSLSTDGDVPETYRQLASFKALLLKSKDMDAATRKIQIEGVIAAGGPLRLFAEEQMALAELDAGEADAAMARLQRILQDAETTGGLRQRASQLIVALGGTPEAAPVSAIDAATADSQ